ncbi:MAG: hypothetical protein R3A47_10650 [Polyangiales bacterium]
MTGHVSKPYANAWTIDGLSLPARLALPASEALCFSIGTRPHFQNDPAIALLHTGSDAATSRL